MERNAHLNIFYSYSLRENEQIKEDNITRATLLTFEKMSSNGKIYFINSIIGNNLLPIDDYLDFEIELQPTKKSELEDNKFLVGFCPNGCVEGEREITRIADSIYNSTVDHDARADGLIRVFFKKKAYMEIYFENKLVDLKYNQLKRHILLLLGIQNRRDIEKCIKIFDYRNFYSLFNNSDGLLNNDLINFLYLSGNLCPVNFKDLSRIKYNYKKQVEYLLGKTLDIISFSSKGMRDRQQGWGETIKYPNNDYLGMIGLIFNEDKGKVELNFRFGSKMSTARNLYKKIEDRHIDFSNNFKGSFCVNYVLGYIENSYIETSKNVNNYVNYVMSNPISEKNDISSLKEYIRGLINSANIEYNIDDFPFEDKRLQQGHIRIVPSLVYFYEWNVNDLYKYSVEDFSAIVNSIIKKVSAIMDIKIL